MKKPSKFPILDLNDLLEPDKVTTCYCCCSICNAGFKEEIPNKDYSFPFDPPVCPRCKEIRRQNERKANP